METLDLKLQRMRRIFRGEEAFGAGTAAEQSQRFRIAEIYEDAVDQARRNSEDVERPPVDLLISLSGFSPETTLLAYELIKPKQLLIIYSESTKASLDVIWAKLAGRVAFSDVSTIPCDPADPVSIYHAVSKAVLPARRSGEPRSTMIDITGGKKAMSAGAALAAAQLDLPMCYIDSTYDREMRQALPGSEKLRVLANPTKLFGDRDMDSAMAMFAAGDYSGANRQFAELSASVSEPARARFLRDLSALYKAWCDLDVGGLPDLISAVRGQVRDGRAGIDVEMRYMLNEQLAFAEELAQRTGSALLLNFFLLGEHYFALGRYDFAALLFYRTIEKAFQERLTGRYELKLDEPDFALLNEAAPRLLEDYIGKTKEVYGESAASLPRKIALMDAMIILVVCRDPLLSKLGWKSAREVRSMRGVVESRNRSILAHGTESVTKKDCENLRSRATAVMRTYWALHDESVNFDERVSTLRFASEV
ncbi:hypothetical protein [Catellatospora citrea]|uniref:CRISPR-associated protein n=1 Tax=Catellatospora citrea TaxID=53366 RepID=A0A8J3KIK8_9ACTN|nr:hypothetical protein [Catellatospora citrea]RKE11115.1 CRISPR-associated protein Cas02710 family [Catellatospora citrea]GIF96574.1 CRISPR-associated protein [Catellatospora citrea]